MCTFLIILLSHYHRNFHHVFKMHLFDIIVNQAESQELCTNHYRFCIVSSSVYVELYSILFKGFPFFVKPLWVGWPFFIKLNKSAEFQFVGEMQSYLDLLLLLLLFPQSLFWHSPVYFKGKNVHFRYFFL